MLTSPSGRSWIIAGILAVVAALLLVIGMMLWIGSGYRPGASTWDVVFVLGLIEIALLIIGAIFAFRRSSISAWLLVAALGADVVGRFVEVIANRNDGYEMSLQYILPVVRLADFVNNIDINGLQVALILPFYDLGLIAVIAAVTLALIGLIGASKTRAIVQHGVSERV